MFYSNLGAKHCAFTFDVGKIMIQNGVQILNAKSLAPRLEKPIG
jgi:hypothetical protein